MPQQGGGGYSGAASGSASSTFANQVSQNGGDINNESGFVFPRWAIPLAIVLGFGALIVWLLTRK